MTLTTRKVTPKVALLTVAAAIAALMLGMASAQAGLSPVRRHGAPASVYLRAAYDALNLRGLQGQAGPVLFEKSSFKNAHWERVPPIDSTVMQTSFEFARDEKAHTDENLRARRATWLYPDDGCFVRAVMAADFIAKKSNVKPMKIFAFDNLTVKTANSPSGEVEWWYHVAAITKVVDAASGTEKFYVYDPAIQPKAPMEVTDWLKAMHAPNAQIAICATDAYDPDSNCETGEADAKGRAQNEASWFLPSEWSRLEELGRDPKAELGEKPPWL
ncbi:hypothetical protein BH10BDE1_BH10BDE1_24510 [soil metagenome]